ncbi:zinc-binding alcohol dehydrogenase family protein [Altererythrobacter sp. MF3-039]|uniref:quinone oxidoreductase family protein n=1 Tax=Altererythrobacter sp. MF3-039 TaxID=3252901 RepID=UPI00390C7340
MKGFIVHEFGGPENMLWEDLPDPECGADEVVIDVRASGINFAETRMRAGTYSGQPLPFVMGMEAAGDVDAVGANVEGYAVGDRVFGRARGAHAEKVAIHKDHVMKLPDNLTYVEGAAIPVGWLTAWHALHTVARLQAGERVIIEAVASSVGSAALQIAKQAGAWVAGTASQDEKLGKAAEYGLDLAINYKAEDMAARIAEETGGEGCGVGMMTIGQETAEALMACMGMDGRVTLYGSTSGKDITINLIIGTHNLQLLSMSISTSPAFIPVTMDTFRQRALPKFADGTFKPIVSTVLPISELVRAHEMVGERHHFGKIILEI